MQSSSLIFLVIIAIWAAYLLQHWIRRREHLATARSVDRFSDAMRVLERRSPLSESNLSAPRPRSYAVSPARPSLRLNTPAPEVVVKRAQSPTSNASTRTAPAVRPAAAVRPTRTFHALAWVSARRVRGLSLLASLCLVITVSALALLSVLPWWSAPAAIAVLVLDFVWLRHAAAAERATRRASAGVNRAKVPARRATVPGQGAAATPARSAVRSGTRSAAQHSAQAERPVAAPVAGAAEVSEPAGSPAEADVSAWAPVPVPPPTYTLKAKAERPEPVPAAVTEPAVTEPAPAPPSSFDGLVDEGELDGLLDRRRAAGA